jgi:hypothetical protein
MGLRLSQFVLRVQLKVMHGRLQHIRDYYDV